MFFADIRRKESWRRVQATPGGSIADFVCRCSGRFVCNASTCRGYSISWGKECDGLRCSPNSTTSTPKKVLLCLKIESLFGRLWGSGRRSREWKRRTMQEGLGGERFRVLIGRSCRGLVRFLASVQCRDGVARCSDSQVRGLHCSISAHTGDIFLFPSQNPLQPMMGQR
jgi:hypothetical protein